MLLDKQRSCSSKVSLEAKTHNPTQAAERKLRNQRLNHPPVQGGWYKKMDDRACSPGCDLRYSQIHLHLLLWQTLLLQARQNLVQV